MDIDEGYPSHYKNIYFIVLCTHATEWVVFRKMTVESLTFNTF